MLWFVSTCIDDNDADIDDGGVVQLEPLPLLLLPAINLFDEDYFLNLLEKQKLFEKFNLAHQSQSIL